MTAVHTRYISRNWPRGCASTASPRAPPPGQDTPHQECPPPTLWPCCSPGTCITTGPSQGPQRSPDRQADSDHGSVLDRLREDASARHDFFPHGPHHKQRNKSNDMPTVAIDRPGRIGRGAKDLLHRPNPCSSGSRPAVNGVQRVHVQLSVADKNRGPKWRACCPRDHGLRGTRPGTASTRCTCGTPGCERRRPVACGTRRGQVSRRPK
jgi:hypothetical protein